MTDNEIYEALHKAGESVDFATVYLWNWMRDEPIIIRFSDVVDLVNRQNAEIDRLKQYENKWHNLLGFVKENNNADD